MGGAVEDQLSMAVRALQSGEMFLIEQVLDVELQVNALQMEIDELCTNTLLVWRNDVVQKTKRQQQSRVCNQFNPKGFAHITLQYRMRLIAEKVH